MPKYLIAFIIYPQGIFQSNEDHEKDREYHEFETIACPGSWSFWFHVHSSFPGTTEKLEWVKA